MSKKDKEHLYFIIEKIEDLESYIKSYEKVSLLLKDKMGKDASLMCLLQIGETLNKLESYDKLDVRDVKGAYDVRNFIAHDYMGVDLALVEYIIKFNIPKLKETIKILIKEQFESIN